jgi:hypothetical protein
MVPNVIQAIKEENVEKATSKSQKPKTSSRSSAKRSAKSSEKETEFTEDKTSLPILPDFDYDSSLEFNNNLLAVEGILHGWSTYNTKTSNGVNLGYQWILLTLLVIIDDSAPHILMTDWLKYAFNVTSIHLKVSFDNKYLTGTQLSDRIKSINDVLGAKLAEMGPRATKDADKLKEKQQNLENDPAETILKLIDDAALRTPQDPFAHKSDRDGNNVDNNNNNDDDNEAEN